MDIGRLVVHPAYFRRGIARKLVESMEAIGGIHMLTVSTGALNTPARHLYERMGYHCIEEVTLPEGVAIAYYEKRLA